MHRRMTRERGWVLMLAAVLALTTLGAWLALESLARGSTARRDAASDRALAQAREALVAYAADRPINAWVGPGYLPCPDLDGDGWAEPTCGSQSGDLGQAQRLGHLPWKTLGLADLRDGYGERLWYAVSSKHKGLLNCAANRACVDMSPDAAIGTISVRDASGALLHDGTSTDLYAVDRTGALAVVLAPGPPLGDQHRDCRQPPCAAAAYLDRAPPGRHAAEGNADFVDRNDAAGRARNTDGFIQGPLFGPDGRPAVNDRIAVIAYRDVMPRVMKRVALEVAHCLAFYGSRPENGGRYPMPVPACRQALPGAAIAWREGDDTAFGRIPDTPFTRSREASGGRMLERWWRHEPRAPERLAELPTRAEACKIAFEPLDDASGRRLAPGTPSEEGRTAGLSENAWWTYWKPFVFYVLAPAFRAGGVAGCADARGCIEVSEAANGVVARAKHFAVIVAGPPLALPALEQRHAASPGDARHWLEDLNAALERANPNPAAPECSLDPPRVPCGPDSCLRVLRGPVDARFNDVVAAHP